MRTLKTIRELYTPKSADEKRFVDKHVVKKTKDANGNKDDVFNASNVKSILDKNDKKESKHGYAAGKDEEVYEEAELNEVLRPSMGAKAYIDDFIKSNNPRFKGKSKKKRIQMALGAYYADKREAGDADGDGGGE